jgi:peroxiredoxin
VDSVWANKAFKEQLGVDFPILSDSKHEVAKKYGVLDEDNGVARRTTFVIDTSGVVQHIDQAREALDPNGAIGVCERIHKK